MLENFIENGQSINFFIIFIKGIYGELLEHYFKNHELPYGYYFFRG